MFFVISAFYTKATGKTSIGFQYVLKQFQEANIGFDIQKDITELTNSMQDLNNNMSKSGIEGIAKTIYYSARFLVKLVFHSLIATINIIICVLRCIGLNMPYIRLTGQSPKDSFPIAGNVVPSWWPPSLFG